MADASKSQESDGKKKPFDLINRGVKRSTPLGSAAFIGLRSLDCFLQYSILAHGLGSSLLHKCGLETIPAGTATATGTFIDALGLSPHRLVLLSMATGSAVKQIFWLLVTAQEEFPVKAAIPVSIYNTVFNSLNDLLFTCALTSSALSPSEDGLPVSLLVGSAMYTFGILVEAISEVQRRRFKDDPKNEGKVYTGGLFRYARHVNYTGYSFWRAGYSMSAAGWVWGGVVGAWLLYDFGHRAVVVLDNYCSNRYGEQWEQFKKQTPYKVLPFIY